MPEPTLLSTANIGTTEGLIPALGAGGKLASSLLPSIALTETLSVANAAARLALTTAQAQGKIVIEADTGKSYGLVTAGTPATSGDWLQLGDNAVVAADITDFASAVAATAAVTANTAKTTNQTHTGDVTGATALTIADDAVTNAKLANMVAQRIKGRGATGTGDPEDLTIGSSLIFGGTALLRNALTGDVTASVDSNATTIANDAVTNAKLANVATATIKGRATAGTGDPEDLTAAQAKTLLATTAADITDSTAAGRAILTAADAPAQITALGAATPASVEAQITAAAFTSAQIMTKAGERLIASLNVVRLSSNAGTCYFATTRSTSGTFTVKTTTGYARLVNSDNTLGAQAGDGNAANNITLTIPASGLHRALGIISVVNGGTVQSGNITLLNIQSQQLTTFSGTGLNALTTLDISNNQLTTFSGTGLSSLTTLNLTNNQLTTFSGTGLSSLTTLNLTANQLTTFSGTGLSSLTTLTLTTNQLTTFSDTGLSALTTLTLSNNQLTTFSGTGLSSLTSLSLSSNPLTSYINHPPLIGSVGGNFTIRLEFTNLDATQLDAALNALYQPPGAANGVIDVRTNGGTVPTAASLTARNAYVAAGWFLLTN